MSIIEANPFTENNTMISSLYRPNPEINYYELNTEAELMALKVHVLSQETLEFMPRFSWKTSEQKTAYKNKYPEPIKVTLSINHELPNKLLYRTALFSNEFITDMKEWNCAFENFYVQVKGVGNYAFCPVSENKVDIFKSSTLEGIPLGSLVVEDNKLQFVAKPVSLENFSELKEKFNTMILPKIDTEAILNGDKEASTF